MTSNPNRRWLAIGLAVIATALVAAGALGFSYSFLRDPAPPAVALASGSPAASASADATASQAGESAAATPTATTAATGDGTSLDGTWSVDPTVGSFADFSGSFVGYRVQEELANVGAATAVGRTPDVTGSLVLEGTTVSSVEIAADLSTLQSDNNMRDGQLRRQALETGTFRRRPSS